MGPFSEEERAIQRYQDDKQSSKRLRRLIHENKHGAATLHGQHRVGAWLFRRFLGLAFLAVFLSLWQQGPALYSPAGLLPLSSVMSAALSSGQGSGSSLLWAFFPSSYPAFPFLQHQSQQHTQQLPISNHPADPNQDSPDQSLDHNMLLDEDEEISPSLAPPNFELLDRGMRALVLAGCVGSVLVLAGCDHVLPLGLLWAAFVSFQSLGGPFLTLPGYGLLCEVGFVGVLLGTWLSWSGLPPGTKAWRPEGPPPAAVALCHWMCFRVLFSAGVAKLTDSWTSLQATQYLHETQPLPTPISWYLHALPPAWHELEVMVLLAAQLLLPFLVLGPRRYRHLAALCQIALQLLSIFACGNGFSPHLLIALPAAVIDDRCYLEHLPPFAANFFKPRVQPRTALSPKKPSSSLRGALFSGFFRVRNAACLLFALALFLASLHPFLLHTTVAQSTPLALSKAFELASSYHILSPPRHPPYLFSDRRELQIEGSHDGLHWLPIDLPYKPGSDLSRAPQFTILYSPFVDWQMALLPTSHPDQPPEWFLVLLEKILQHSSAVLPLLQADRYPFHEAPPRHIRVLQYGYSFTTSFRSKAWWARSLLGEYLPASNLTSLSARHHRRDSLKPELPPTRLSAPQKRLP